MIRAVIKEGKIWPLDPLPEEWSEGSTLEIEGYLDSLYGAESLERWYHELEAGIGEDPMTPEDVRQLDEALAEQDRIAKEQVRREMGLS